MGKKDKFIRMKNSFQSYEADYLKWKEKLLNGASFSDLGIKSQTLGFIKNVLTQPNQPDFLLYEHQKEAMLRIVYAYEIIREIDPDRSESFKHLLLEIVTGGGKTVNIAMAIIYLRECHNVDKFLVLTPNTIVRDRLQDDFSQTVNGIPNKTIFQKLGLFSATDWEDISRNYDTAITYDSPVSELMVKPIILSNVQQLYYGDTSSDNAKQRLAAIYNNCTRLAIFNDEAHNTKAEEYENILVRISGKTVFSLDTTATPERADGKVPDSRKIFEFGVQEALKQNLVKAVHVFEPVIHDYEFYDEATGKTLKMEDMSEEELEEEVKGSRIVTKDPTIVRQLEIAMERLKEAEKRAAGTYSPLLFVITRGINDANRVKEILTGKPLHHASAINPFKYYKEEVLVVTEESTDQERVEARDIRKGQKSIIKVIVSVQMLREGWDVSEVSAILLLRKFSSRVYGQQVVGRGLRRFDKRNRTNREILSVVDFPKLDHEWLWKLMFAETHKDVKKGDKIDISTKFDDELEKLGKIVIADQDIEAIRADFSDLENKSFKVEEIPNWKEVVSKFNYALDRKTLKDIQYDGLVEKNLHTRFETESDYESKIDVKLFQTKSSKEHLAEQVKYLISEMAEDLLNLSGHPITDKKYLYEVLLNHVSLKFFDKKSISGATIKELERANNHLSDVKDNFADAILIESILKYR